MSVVASALAAASAACQPFSLEGTAVLGFESSYVVPSRGELRRQKIWVENANLLATHLDRAGIPRRMWRRGPVKLSGCLARGHFGHLGLYKYQLKSLNVAN